MVNERLWQTTNIKYGAKLGLATAPKKLKNSGIKRLLERALWEQGIRQTLADGIGRHEWKAAHGFRKFYKTHAEQVMKPINVELTLGHNIGISASYYKPNENEVLEDYLTAVESLTISNDKTKLTKQIAELKQRSKKAKVVSTISHATNALKLKDNEERNDKSKETLLIFSKQDF